MALQDWSLLDPSRSSHDTAKSMHQADSGIEHGRTPYSGMAQKQFFGIPSAATSGQASSTPRPRFLQRNEFRRRLAQG